jgi:asparagine synthase (glutamine-hydrolysing)
MVSPCGRWAIAFNGEVYNFEALRAELDGAGHGWSWAGHSDTEVLLATIRAYGVRKALELCVGMFAFALWDAKTRQLTLARDRLGEKPLYVGQVGRDLVFGSELSAFYRHPSWEGQIDLGALTLMMRHNYVPSPYSIFNGITKLEPGTFAVYDQADASPMQTTYWSARETVLAGQDAPFNGSPSEAVDALETLLGEAVQGQMVADVPLGAFLSGGIDSSTVVALMQQASSKQVMTFSIGFMEEGYNEAVHAKAVASHLGTDHTELYVSPREAMDCVPRLASVFSEPFSDSSQIPTLLVSYLARQSVTVSLSGDGGDELFSGYNRYGLSDALWGKLSRVPTWARAACASALTCLSVETINAVARPVMRLGPAGIKAKRPGEIVHKFAGVLSLDSQEAVYQRLVSHWQDPSKLVVDGAEPRTALTDPASAYGIDETVRRMMLLDTLSYLPDDILVKVDRAAMSVGLETRVPMLDHRVFEFAAKLPMSMLRREGVSKWPLRQVLHRYVPRSLVERPKMGFGVPIGTWLRGDLAEWADGLLSPAALSDGYFDADLVSKTWQEHRSGRRNHEYLLWDVLMFQAWRDEHRASLGNTVGAA